MTLNAPTVAKYQEITTSGTSFATSSWTPNASDRLYLLWEGHNIASGTVSSPTSVTGNGLTWTKVRDSQLMDGSTRMGSLWAAFGTGSAGATTITMGVTHQSCIVTILEQDGVTGTDAILQSADNKSENAQTLEITVGAFAASDNTCLAFYYIKNASSGGATGVDVDPDMTELVEDRIDANRAVYVQYQLSENLTPLVTLTGDADGNYTLHRMTGVAIEIGASVTLVAQVEIIIDIDPADLEEDEEETPPEVVGVPSSEATDAQAVGARPNIARSSDLVAVVNAIEQRQRVSDAQHAARLGFLPILAADPTNPTNGFAWIRELTGELCWRIGDVTQVLPPSTPIAEEG